MSHKKKPASAVPASTDTAALAAHADASLGAARYKDAIEHFKGLLKRERRTVWLDGLAAAYAGRAEQLAGKGMVKEAVALWRTRADACGVSLLGGPYVAWLLQSGQVEQALGLLATVDQLPPEAQALARSQLAGAVLVAPDRLLTGLPADSPLLNQRAAARAALAACVRGDATALADALQAISFRSPYRDLRPLLKALALQTSDPQQAAQALARVPGNGPFEPLARALRVCLMPATGWLAGARQLDEAGRTLVLDLKGCPESQRALVLDLMARAGDAAPTPLELCDVLLRHRRALAAGVARSVCLRLLPHAPQRLDAFRASFPPLLAAEQERALALAAELKEEPDEAETHWLRLVKLLGATPADGAGRQRAALVLRRLADAHASHSPDGKLCLHARDWLGQSLALDPADLSSHLRLVRDARLCADLRQARTWLDAARKHFPADASLLQEAVEIALAAGSFKKAAGLAKQVLQLDPINPRVRTLIGQAHLAHARKQLKAQSPQAARRELDEAATWLRSAGERGLVKLLQGLSGDAGDAGDALLREAMGELGGSLVGALHLLLEAHRAKREPGALVRRAGVDLAATPGASDVVALAHALNTLPERDAALPAALGGLSGMLKRAAGGLSFSESDHLLVCEALHRHGQRDLTRHFAETALKRWPQRPVFVYLDAAARFGAEPWRMPERDQQRLDRVFEQAQDQGDPRTAARLSKLLDATGAGRFDDDDLLPELGDLGPGGVRGVMAMMLAIGGEDSFLDMARAQLGKATFDQLRRDIKGSKKQFAQSLIELLVIAKPEPLPPIRILPPNRPPTRPTPPTASKQTGLFDD